ncbi:MAG: phospho-sugar mutase [Bacteriovoracales bacterium]|nr:phospho-sugar mutase [Bacteriovoracales bacterium]
MEEHIIARAKAWIESPFIEDGDRQIVQRYLDDDDRPKLKECFHRELSFGTGGMRALIGPGTNKINRYTVSRVSQAFACALADHFHGDISLCIGFDCRKNSELFAREAARVMAANGVRVHLFDHMVPTPILSYAVRYFKAQGGIMVTASHNPKDYNGLKAYWDDGCQVTPPNDEAIIAHYQKLNSLAPIKQADFQKALGDGQISLIEKDCEDSYYEMLASQCLTPDLCQEHGPTFPMAFTPLHGTGWGPVKRALAQIGFTNVHPVAEQTAPDENFPTVNPPNPEERAALEKVMALMEEVKAKIALATDPDTDRLGVVVRHRDKLWVLNGNQIALLMLHYILEIKRERKMIKENSLLIKTIVTSDLLAQVAESFGLIVENTLTGFKWICGKMREYEEQGKPFDFILGTEESFGYLSHDFCRDKDGLNACALMAEAALYHHTQGKTLMEALDSIYDRYGYSWESLLSLYYEGARGAEKIERIMDYFRHIKKNLPDLIKADANDRDDPIVAIEDYLQGEIIHLTSNEQTKLNLPKSNVLGLLFESGNKLYLRPSGTEPKIKFYTMVIEKEGALEDKKRRARKKAQDLEYFIREKCEFI